MLHDRRTEFVSLVWMTVRRTGRSAPRIANDLMGRMFPESMVATQKEGGDRYFRAGVIAAIKRVIKQKDKGAPTQADFDEIDPSFRPLVESLGSATYYVEQLRMHMTVRELIDDPELLDDARKFMRRKTDENLAETRKLDALYEAVIAKRDGSGQTEET
jgi:hypothetical protein